MKTYTLAVERFNDTGMNLSHINPTAMAFIKIICNIVDENNQKQAEQIRSLKAKHSTAIHKLQTKGNSE